MNWALKQKLPTPQQQILLYVIADSADPDGLTWFCNPLYLERHARLPRSTVFRILGEFEQFALLERRKFYTDKGEVRYEIQLNFGCEIDLPIRRRKKTEDTANSTDDDTDPQDEEMNEIPESQPGTLVEGDQSPSPEGPKSQSRDFHIDPPSLSKESSPYPLPGGSRSKLEQEQEAKREALWIRFKSGYPGIAAMDQNLAREELDALSLDEAEWATSVLPALSAELHKLRDRAPKNAHLWLRKRLFENFARGKLDAPPAEVWIAEGSPEFFALRLLRLMARIPSPMVHKNAEGVLGYRHLLREGMGELREDLLAMRAFEGQSDLRWPRAPLGSAESAAWRQRFVKWLGVPLAPRHGEDYLRVPCRWPPNIDGTIYLDDEPQNDPMNDPMSDPTSDPAEADCEQLANEA